MREDLRRALRHRKEQRRAAVNEKFYGRRPRRSSAEKRLRQKAARATMLAARLGLDEENRKLLRPLFDINALRRRQYAAIMAKMSVTAKEETIVLPTRGNALLGT